MKKLITLLMMSILAIGVGWAATITFGSLGLENGAQYLDPFDGGDFTVTFSGSSNDGKYYTIGSGIRVYGGGSMTVAAKSGTITEITVAYDGSNMPTSGDVVNVGTYNASTGIWTGSADSVVFTRPSGSGHWRVKSVSATFTYAPPPASSSMNARYTVTKLWGSENVPASADCRQGVGLNGKFYINNKTADGPTVMVYSEGGLESQQFPGGLNCGINIDQAGHLIVSLATFPNRWVFDDETPMIRVINPETGEKTDLPLGGGTYNEGRLDVLGRAYGNLLGSGELYLPHLPANGTINRYFYEDGKVLGEVCYNPLQNPALSADVMTIINAVVDADGNDAIFYYQRGGIPYLYYWNGDNLEGKAINIPASENGMVRCNQNGADFFAYNGKNFVVYPCGAAINAYYDGFAIYEIGAKAPLFVKEPTIAAASNTFQANWLNAEVTEDGVIIYQYVPGKSMEVYKLSIPKPTYLRVTDITRRSAVAYWDGSAPTYNFRYREKTGHLNDSFATEEASAGWIVVENTTAPVTMEPLTANTTYECQVQGVYADGYSPWSDLVRFTTLNEDGISIYVKANQAPYLYAWYDNISQCGEWPGTLLSEKVTINREQYYMYHFDLGMINVIFNNGYGGQTGDFTNITKDAFFIYDGNDLAYGLIPPEVYGNSEGEYAFFVNTDGWEQVYAVVDGNTYPMTKVGVDGAGFEVYKWEVPNIDLTPSTITFNNGAGSGIQDVNGDIYTSEYVKGGYYVYSFFLNHSVVRLDRVTTILYDDSSQRPAIEDCSITMNSTKDVWNGLSSIEFQIRGTYFSQQARQGSVWYSVDNRDWVEFTSLLNSEQQFDENIMISFVRNHSVHSIRLAAKDLSGTLSNVMTVLEAIDAQNLSCNNLPDAEYTGQAITFDPAISDMNGTELVLNEDYTFTISDNVNAGNAILDIQANYPRYIGYQRLYFNISPHTIAGLITLSDGDSYCYTGYPITPEVVVYDQTFGTLTVNQDYVVSYLDNENVGTGVVVIDGIGNFTGHFEHSFEIVDITLGDLDFDGFVTIGDLNSMLNIIFFDDDYVAVADMNKDRIINVQDVVGLVHLLLTGDIPHISPNVRRAPKNDYAAHASLYWQDGTLYLDSPVPVAAVNIINDVDNHITWNLDSYGMVVMQDSGEHGMHSVLFSFDRGVIPPGMNPIATTDCQSPSVVGAELCDPESRLINVQLNENLSGIADIRKTAGINCDMSGSKLVINCDAALHDVDINVYTIDGMVVDNRHLPMLNRGTTSIEMSDLVKSNRFMIIAVLIGGQVLATQILTQ